MEKNIVFLYNIYATIIALFCYPKPRARLSKTDGFFIIYSKAVFFKKFIKKVNS